MNDLAREAHQMIKFFIPGKPVAKGRPRFAMAGHRIIAYTPDATRAWERMAAQIAKIAMRGNPPLGCPVRIEIHAVLAPPKRDPGRKHHVQKPDLDNICKGAVDSMNGIIFADDAQIVERDRRMPQSGDRGATDEVKTL